MHRTASLALGIVGLALAATPGLAQHKPEVIEKSKRATALVEVATAEVQATGSAFCIDRSGLFITNAHVVRAVAEAKGSVRLVVDIGLKTQRSLRAKVLRADDSLDLALLKVDSDARLTTLELGKDDQLRDTAPVITFGFPFGHRTTVRGEAYPDITVIASRITSLRRDKGRLEGVQFDGQLNPGNSGGPVVDESGRVIGVAVATVRGAAMNLAVPVGRLSEFLTAPGLVFEPPPLAYKDRSMPVTWTIKVQPPTPKARLPEKLSVTVTIANGIGEPRTFTAQPLGDGVFRVKVTPVPRDPDRQVDLDVRFPNGQAAQVKVKDGDVSVGGTRFLLSDLRVLFGGPSPRVQTTRGQVAFGPIAGLGKVRTKVGKKTVPIDLNEAAQIMVRPVTPPTPVRAVEALVEAKQGTTVLATVHKRADLSGAPAPSAVGVRVGRDIVIIPANTRPPMIAAPQGPSDDGIVTIGGVLDVDGTPRGAGRAIRPPSAPMGEAIAGSSPHPAGEIRQFVGHNNVIWNVAISPDGRRMLTASHDVTVRLWDVESGRQLRVLAGHSDHVKAVAFLPDGRRGISGGDDDTVRLWDLETGRELRRFLGHTADIWTVAVSPDGRRALSGAMDRTIILWDMETGRALRRMVGHGTNIGRVLFLPDGHRALSSADDGTVRLWDLELGREIRRIELRAGRVASMAASPDGRLLAVGCVDGAVRVWESDTGRMTGELSRHDDAVISVTFTPDGRRIVSSGGDKDRSIRVWDVAGSRQLQCLRGFPGGPGSLAVAPDGHSLAVAIESTVRLWRLPEPDAAAEDPSTPLVRRFDGKISDVAVGGGGRYLILTLKEAHKLAVFDVNTADVVKTIPLPSENVLVAAGARTVLVAFPDQSIIQRTDLEALDRPARTFPSPIKARLKALAMGIDSDGPLLAVWTPDSSNTPGERARFTFLDAATLKVLKAGPLTNGGLQGIGSVSPSGGSLLLHPFLTERVHVRASAGGDLFAIWHTHANPSGFQTLAVYKATLRGIYNHEGLDHLAPGPDGETVYTGRGGALNAQGKPVRGSTSRPSSSPEATIPSPDPAYYLSITGLVDNRPQPSPTGAVAAAVHAAADGERLLTIQGLDEMGGQRTNESWIEDDFTLDKRFHLVPAANLLITIPFSNDRLVLRRLEIRKALEHLGRDYLVITSCPSLHATAGKPITHKIEALSKAGGTQFTLTQGPDGLTVSPDGKLSWLPPKGLAGDAAVTAVVTVSDSSGQQRFHTLRIRVD